MKRVLRYAVVFTLLFMLALTGCEKEPENEKKDVEENDRILIGFSFDNFVMERWERDRDIFVSKMNEMGADVNVQNANGSVEVQKNQISYFIEKGCDVIVIVAIDGDSLKDEVKKAHDAGIKVVAYDRLINDADVDLYITFDNYKVGSFLAEAVNEAVAGEKNVILLTGPTTDNNVGYLNDGFNEISDANKFNMLDVQYFEGWNQDLGYQYVNNNIELVEKADAIICGNDAIAGQVIRGLSEHRLAGKIVVAGQDADLESCQRIVEGTQYMTVYKPINELAESAASYVYLLAEDEDMSFTGSISDGTNFIPYVAIKPYAVTRENMDELIIDSGFHRREDVYLNVEP